MSTNYKDTLLMPQTDFEMKGNLKNKEPQIQSKWLEQEIYQKVLAKNKSNQQFNLHDGPPYANGNIHVGHAMNKILKDIIIRFKNHQGYYANYIPGWDTHGLPIENAISKIDKDFEKQVSAVEKRRKCRAYAIEQVANQTKQFRRLGLMTDFKQKYLTLDLTFILDELNLFKTMIMKELIFQASKPIYWSWSSQCALAEAEIEYENVKSPSIYVKFKLVDEDANLLIWTTTPWTIPSNLAIAINPKINYAYVKANNEIFIVAENLIDSLKKELEWNDVSIIKTISAQELATKKYSHPWINQVSPIILADYVSADNGTGLVHNAPGFGQDDYYACKANGIDIYCPIDAQGKFTDEINDDELLGMFYLKANDIIIDRLRKSNNLVKMNEIVHSVAHDWRTHKPVMYRATKQWFINISKIKNNISHSLKNDVSSQNAKTIERIIEMIDHRYEWCISRQRVWGVPIPIIYDENMAPILDLKLIEHIINIIAKEGVDVWFEKDVKYFIPSWMDQSKNYTKEKDILDVWFDSGSSFNVLKHYQLNYPADLYLEGSDQFRGWFNSSAINGTIENNHVPYKFLLQHGFILDEQGIKMSKSKGNVLDPIEICNDFGADILRLWVASTEYQIDVKFGKNILNQVAETYKKIRNTLFRYTLSNLSDFNYDKDFVHELRMEDYYVLTRLKNITEQVTNFYESYDFLNVTKTILNFTNELSQWYFDIIKDPLYCDDKDSLVRKQIQSTLYVILKTISVLLNPIIPHTCEELYDNFKNLKNKQLSINLEPWPNLTEIEPMNQEFNDLFNKFFELKNQVYQALEKARNNNLIKKNNEATVYLNNSTNIKEEQLAKWLNVAKVVNHQQNDIVIKNDNLKKCLRCWNHYEPSSMANDEICLRCSRVLNK